MFRALNLTLAPEGAWQKTSLKPPGAIAVLFLSLLPLLILTLAVEGYALLKFGEVMGDIGLRAVERNRVYKYEIFYAAASLLVIFIGASLLKYVSESFNLRAPFSTCFVLIAFAYSPVLAARMVDGIPQINTWICWAAGVALSARVLYHGVGWWLKPEQTKGFGLFVICSTSLVVLSGLVHFAAIQVLHGRVLKNWFETQI